MPDDDKPWVLEEPILPEDPEPDALAARRANIAKRLGKGALKAFDRELKESAEACAPEPKTTDDVRGEILRKKKRNDARRHRSDGAYVAPESVEVTEQTWHAKIALDLEGKPYCDGVCLVHDGEPAAYAGVVETDSGIYPPSVMQAHLISAAPELYRALRDLEAAFVLGADREEIERIRSRGREAMSKAVGLALTLKKRKGRSDAR